jgi:hypothetical protein
MVEPRIARMDVKEQTVEDALKLTEDAYTSWDHESARTFPNHVGFQDFVVEAMSLTVRLFNKDGTQHRVKIIPEKVRIEEDVPK